MAAEPLLRVRNLKKYFPIRGGLLSREVARVHAVDDVSFDILPGETLGLVGDQEVRVAGQRHGDHHALAHAAGELVRVVVDAALGIGNPHQT